MSTGSRQVQVALIEDNPADVYLVREAMRANGLDYELMVIDNFEDAIDAVVSGGMSTVDALLIDLNLRTGSGLDILDAIRRSADVRNTPVAIFTSSDSPRDRQAAHELGANLFIRKPTDLDGFLNEVANVFGHLIGGRSKVSATAT
jgi:two-component system, chemotaxis family, response regulator Rcp1